MGGLNHNTSQDKNQGSPVTWDHGPVQLWFWNYLELPWPVETPLAEKSTGQNTNKMKLYQIPWQNKLIAYSANANIWCQKQINPAMKEGIRWGNNP